MPTVDSHLIAEKQPFVSKPGTSRQNYYLKGLPFKLTVWTQGTVKGIYLYVAGEPENEDNQFDFVFEGGGVYTYETIAGENATALCYGDGDNWEYGVKFYFRIKIIGKNGNRIIDRYLWIREPTDLILIEGKASYISPYPVLIGSQEIKVTIGEKAKDETGATLYGGIETVEVFDTPGAPGSNYVESISEIAMFHSFFLSLCNRDSATGILNFIPPPGAPDFSRYYYYITFRFRAKQESSYYKDVDVLLFAAGDCASDDGSYGYDSDGSDTVDPPEDPPELTLLPPAYPYPPITQCGSYTLLETNVNVNQYASRTLIKIYDAASGGTLLGSGDAIVTGPKEIKITRNALGGNTSVPISGHFGIQEFGPDRISSNRLETFIYQCATPNDGYEITTVTNDGNTVEIETTPGSDVFSEEEKYEVERYNEEYGGTLQGTYDVDYDSNHKVTFETITDLEGWFTILADGTEIVGKREYGNIELATLEPFWIYDIGTNTWSKEVPLVGNMPCNRIDFTSNSGGSGLIIFGGIDDNGNVLSDFHQYDFFNQKWTEYNNPLGARKGAVYMVFLVGGGLDKNDNGLKTWYKWEGEDTFTSIDNGIVNSYRTKGAASFGGILSPANPQNLTSRHMRGSDTWVGYSPSTTLNNVDYPGSTDEVSVSGHRTYIIAGKDLATGIETGQSFYFDLYEWVQDNPGFYSLPDFPEPRYELDAAYYDEDIYVFGGRNSSGQIFGDLWKYDHTTDTWNEITQGATKPLARYGHRLTSLTGGKLVLFGGRGA